MALFADSRVHGKGVIVHTQHQRTGMPEECYYNLLQAVLWIRAIRNLRIRIRTSQERHFFSRIAFVTLDFTAIIHRIIINKLSLNLIRIL